MNVFAFEKCQVAVRSWNICAGKQESKHFKYLWRFHYLSINYNLQRRLFQAINDAFFELDVTLFADGIRLFSPKFLKDLMINHNKTCLFFFHISNIPGQVTTNGSNFQFQKLFVSKTYVFFTNENIRRREIWKPRTKHSMYTI